MAVFIYLFFLGFLDACSPLTPTSLADCQVTCSAQEGTMLPSVGSMCLHTTRAMPCKNAPRDDSWQAITCQLGPPTPTRTCGLPRRDTQTQTHAIFCTIYSNSRHGKIAPMRTPFSRRDKTHILAHTVIMMGWYRPDWNKRSVWVTWWQPV